MTLLLYVLWSDAAKQALAGISTFVDPREPHPGFILLIIDSVACYSCQNLGQRAKHSVVWFTCIKKGREWPRFSSSTLVGWWVCSRITETSRALSGSITHVLAVLMRFHFVDRYRNTSGWCTEFITKKTMNVWILAKWIQTWKWIFTFFFITSM